MKKRWISLRRLLANVWVQTFIVATLLLTTVSVLLLYAQTFPNAPFSGAVIGAAGTIFAGWLAWAVIRQQLAWDREFQGQPEGEVLKTLREDLGEILDLLNGIWRAIDLALGSDNAIADSQSRLDYAVATIAAHLPPPQTLDAIEELFRALSPLRRRQFGRILFALRVFFKMAAQLDEEWFGWERHTQKFYLLRSMQVQLSQLHRRLSLFDPVETLRFRDRNKADFRHISTAEQIEEWHRAWVQEMQKRVADHSTKQVA